MPRPKKTETKPPTRKEQQVYVVFSCWWLPVLTDPKGTPTQQIHGVFYEYDKAYKKLCELNFANKQIRVNNNGLHYFEYYHTRYGIVKTQLF